MPESTAFYNEDNKLSSLSKEQRQRLAGRISKKWEQATFDLSELIEESREGWDYYIKNHPTLQQSNNRSVGKADTFNTSKQKGLRLGLIPKVVDSIVSLLHNSTFPADERFFRGTPKNQVALENQELVEQFMSDNMAEANVTEEFRKLYLTLAIDPAACVALPWKQTTRKKVIYETPQLSVGGITIPLPMLGLKEKVIPDFVEWEGTKVECLDFNDWRVDPTARSMEESWFMRRWYEPTWKVKEDYGLKKVDSYAASYELVDDPLGNRKRELSGLVVPIPFDDEEEGKDQALLMIYYDDIVIDGKVYKNHAAVCLNGQDIIWFGENPYNHGKIPYVVHSLNPIPNQIYGIPLIHHAVPSAAVADTAVGKALKIGSLAADPIFEVDATERALNKSFQVKPGMTIPVKRANSIRQVQVNIANLPFLMELLDKAEENIREVTGASQMIMGEDFNQPANITAFQVDQHMQGANSRFQAIMKNFNNNVLEPIMFITFENFKQFKGESEYIPVGQENKELSPDLLKQCEFKWIVTSAQAANNRGKRLANAMGLLNDIIPTLVSNGLAQLSGNIPIFDIPTILKQVMLLGGEPMVDQYMQVTQMPPMPMMPPTSEGAVNGPTAIPPNGNGGPEPIPTTA